MLPRKMYIKILQNSACSCKAFNVHNFAPTLALRAANEYILWVIVNLRAYKLKLIANKYNGSVFVYQLPLCWRRPLYAPVAISVFIARP